MAIIEGISSARLQLHLDVHSPIELVEMTLSFQALAYEYRDFLKKKFKEEGKSTANIDDIKLYITKIENNCILAELAEATSVMGSLFTSLEHINTFLEFVKNIKSTADWFRGFLSKKTIKASDVGKSKAECKRFSDLMATVAQNKDSCLGLSVIDYEDNEAKVHLKISFDSNEAFEARKGALLAAEALSQREDATYKNVLMYFQQTNTMEAKEAGSTGDRAIIKAISDKPLRVYFASELDQQKINYEKNDPLKNPLKSTYRVDVNVETDRNNNPVFYRVIHINEVIPPEEN